MRHSIQLAIFVIASLMLGYQANAQFTTSNTTPEALEEKLQLSKN
jgi:hypothetical protein